jgi:hypothetical protein
MGALSLEHYAATSASTNVVVISDGAQFAMTDMFMEQHISNWRISCSIPQWLRAGMVDVAGGNSGGADSDAAFSSAVRSKESILYMMEAIAKRFPLATLGMVTSTGDFVSVEFFKRMWVGQTPMLASVSESAMADEWWRRASSLLSQFETFDSGLNGANGGGFRSFIREGASHCETAFSHAVLESADTFLPWLARMLDGRATSGSIPATVRCPQAACTPATLLGCDGVPGSGKVYDRCAVCGGLGTSCAANIKAHQPVLTAGQCEVYRGNSAIAFEATLKLTGFTVASFTTAHQTSLKKTIVKELANGVRFDDVSLQVSVY